ncbi:uncharacterized protein C8Q71DRAFT_196458 [Rhodofomes roseus]|uniref:Uncharacterized protein n=1 Tax=Rhodofomes roseus TaxID=34475 RepID=A0ABQ8K8X2_9APHY|nr:uncharacterized protein C8Q71DRAFT_196458 [Rhodofomes roseus]KAH9833280.1 hypothetical protein C8Q71DRAFT_196458 [Rhodofomes roseus]
MGPNHHSPSDLLQSPELNVWPVDAICSILPRCTSLSALAVVNCPEDVWGSIGPLLPASVASIHLGSVRAYMQWDWSAMPCYAALASVTSMELDSVWSPRMYKAVATLPGIRTLRRFFPPTLRDTHCAALRRAAAVEHAESMERVEIVGCMFRSPELAPRWREKCAEASHGAVRPGLFVLRTVDGTIAWEVFFEDWVDHLYWSSRQ